MSSATDTTPNNKERTVAIVGRPNVGKSALFNRLAGRRIAIVHDQPGVTRDRIQSECNLGVAPFSIIDTGGIGAATDDDFSAAIRIEADIAMAAADLIIFVVDATEGLTGVDIDFAKQLRKTRCPIIVVANKIDTEGHEGLVDDFSEMGFADTIAASAAHGRGIDEIVPGRRAPPPGTPRTAARETPPPNPARSPRPAECRQIIADQCAARRPAHDCQRRRRAPRATRSMSRSPTVGSTTYSSTPPVSDRETSATAQSKSLARCAASAASAALTSAPW